MEKGKVDALLGIVFGDEGVNCQHAYFQLLHQGTRLIPVDFIVPMTTIYGNHRQHRFTVANAFAQAEALMKGKTADQVRADLEASGMSPQEIETQIPQRTFPGNRPSNTILMNVLRPETLGALMALYEHKTFVQGVIWNINSFDQWGVELGKVLAQTIQKELENNISEEHDSSTSGLIALAKASRK